MARPRFSEMLVERRRKLGLSIKQASSVLRLKEQVLVAFEEGDFASMPKSGYAQGMLASYARYLSLNPRVITRQFSSDLSDWEDMGGRERAMDWDENESLRRGALNRKTYQGTRGLLPASGGYAGDLDSFATTSRVRPKGQSSLAAEGDDARSRPADLEGRRYTSRDIAAEAQDRPNSRYVRTRTRQTRGERARRGRGSQLPPDRERITRRDVTSDDFTDDLRYGSANPYEAASTTTGRRSSRNIAKVDRPNVRRRRSTARTQSSRARGRDRSGGVVSVFGGDTRNIVLFVVFVTIVLTAIIIMSIGSCVRNNNTDTRTVATNTMQTTAGSTTARDTGNSTGEGNGESDNSSDAPSDTDSSGNKDGEDEKTVVSVSVAKGEISWVEIKCDGISEVAEQITGPWKQSYTVTEAISISVNNISAVTVAKNGKTQSFDSKTSGIGSITIKGTKVSSSEDDEDSDASSDSSSKSGSSGSSGSKTDSGKSSKSDSGKSSKSGSGDGSSSSGTSKSGSGDSSSSSSTSGSRTKGSTTSSKGSR